MATTQLKLFGSNARQITPAVVNMFQNNNNVDRLEFTMENYNQGNVDLSTLDPYAICHGKEFVDCLDEVKLTSEVLEDGSLHIYWDLTVMTLSASQTITYQIVFKNDEGQVWTSDKAILFANESLPADEEIVAKYPTILRQIESRIVTTAEEASDKAADEMKEYINDMAEGFDAGVIYIPYGETIPVGDRLPKRLYYQYTNGEHTKGRFEDYYGNVLVSESSGGGGGSSLPMFAPVWSDHLYNDASYLRADNFSWHSSEIYVTAYEKLVEQYNHENSVEKTDGDITYKLTPDGFRIADASQHDDIRYAYENEGRAWYYLLDTENARFKLPHEKNESNKYLYFYVGEYERPATEINVGILTEIANGTDINVIVDEINAAKDVAIAEVSASTMLADLQAQIDSLKAEINTMLGRMDFANAVEVRLDTTTTSYTVPSDGYIQFSTTNANSGAIYINGNYFCHITSVSNGNAGLIPLTADDVLSTNIGSGWVSMTFIPQKGV